MNGRKCQTVNKAKTAVINKNTQRPLCLLSHAPGAVFEIVLLFCCCWIETVFVLSWSFHHSFLRPSKWHWRLIFYCYTFWLHGDLKCVICLFSSLAPGESGSSGPAGEKVQAPPLVPSAAHSEGQCRETLQENSSGNISEGRQSLLSGLISVMLLLLSSRVWNTFEHLKSTYSKIKAFYTWEEIICFEQTDFIK